MLVKCLLLLTFMGTVYCAVSVLKPDECVEVLSVIASNAHSIALVEKKVPGECCPNRTCVPVTCEANGVTYNIGERIPDDDPCGSCECARIPGNLTHGGFLCSSSRCIIKPCPVGTKKVVTQIPGVCCLNVQCVNVKTCLVNEITYNVGDRIPHEDPCYDCRCSESGPVCAYVDCPTPQ